jgi:hypothetical protein
VRERGRRRRRRRKRGGEESIHKGMEERGD